MKKFKAMFAATAAVMALSAVSVPMSAFAEEEPEYQQYVYNGNTDPVERWNPGQKDGQKLSTDPNGPSSPIKVEFTIEPTYLVTIPADVRIATGSREERNSVEVQNVFLNKGKAVQVSVASENAYEMKLNLEGGVLDSANKIPYSLTGEVELRGAEQSPFSGVTIVDRNLSDPVPGVGEFKPIITVPTGSKNEPGLGRAQLTYSISSSYDIPVAGTYSDRLTFKIAVVDAPTSGTGVPNLEPTPLEP